jgi:hypothetical protein
VGTEKNYYLLVLASTVLSDFVRKCSKLFFLSMKQISASSQGFGFNAEPDTDPDPTFFLIADPDPGSGSRV